VRPRKALGRFLWKGGDGKSSTAGSTGWRWASCPSSPARRPAQSGYIFTYAFAMVLGIVALITWMTLGGGAN
jgi:NADH-quinone oxidoreductase subunit L